MPAARRPGVEFVRLVVIAVTLFGSRRVVVTGSRKARTRLVSQRRSVLVAVVFAGALIAAAVLQAERTDSPVSLAPIESATSSTVAGTGTSSVNYQIT